MKPVTYLSMLVIAILLIVVPASAQAAPVVQVVFFFNPDCENCHLVMQNDLPSLQAKYGTKLEILQVDTTQPAGLQLYQAMYRHYQLPDDRLGTPAIVIGKIVLVGVDEIPAKLPGLIEESLTNGGVGWPEIPGLVAYIANSTVTNTYPGPQVYPQPLGQNLRFVQSENISTWERFFTKFKKDPVANSLAVIILAGMIVSVLAILTILVRSVLAENPTSVNFHTPIWLLPLLLIIGLGVAGYLTYIEVGEKQALCGPVGHCNEVQNSTYAKLFSVLPIGVLGLIGYVSLLIAWGVHKLGPKSFKMPSVMALWGMSLFGVAFSIYLTFLEPFVIGATCMWCLSSALVMTALLWITTPLLQDALITDDIVDANQSELLDE